MRWGFGSKSATRLAAESSPLIRILVIDDNDQFCQLIRDVLPPDHFAVVAINSPVKALELFSQDKHGFDLVLLDYFMPHLDGAKTFEWLRKLNPKIKVLICSGADELQLRPLVTQSGMNGYIRKPLNMQEALAVIERVIREPAAGT